MLSVKELIGQLDRLNPAEHFPPGRLADMTEAMWAESKAHGRTVNDLRRRLVAMGEPAFAPLLEAFTDETNSEWLRLQAARMLRDFGDTRAIGPMLDYFNDTRNPCRPSIALYFSRLHDGRVIERLLEAMDEEDVNVRSYAMCSLVTIGEPRTRERLLQALERVVSGEERDQIMRSEVITFTRDLMLKLNDREGFAPAIAPLQKLRNDPDEWIRKNAAKTLTAFDQN